MSPQIDKFTGKLAVVTLSRDMTDMLDLLQHIDVFFAQTKPTIAVVSGSDRYAANVASTYESRISGAKFMGKMEALNRNQSFNETEMIDVILHTVIKNVHGLLVFAPIEQAAVLASGLHRFGGSNLPTDPGIAAAVDEKGKRFTISRRGIVPDTISH